MLQKIMESSCHKHTLIMYNIFSVSISWDFFLLLQMFAEDLCNSLHDRDVVALCRSWPKESLPGEGGSMESDHLGGSMPHCFEPLNDQLRAGQSDKRHIGIG